MTNRVLLNNVDHADLCVVTRHGPEFGDSVNQVLVFPTEFDALQREYPILFRRDANGEMQAVALLGLDRDENLFLADGRWNARYVPATQQRGPFSIAVGDAGPSGGEAQPMIHIDLDHPRVSHSEGERLFLPAGGNAPYLQHVSRLLGVIYDGIEVSRPFFAGLESFGLIEPISLEVQLNDRESYQVPDVHTVSQTRLAALDGAALEQLNGSGLLRAAYAVVSSLGNMAWLVEAKTRKLADGR
jgi:hypothetical protein